MILLSYLNFLIGCLNTILIKYSFFYCDKTNLERLLSEIKDRICAKVTDNSEKVMICSTTIPSTLNTLKNLLVNESSHSSYTNKESNDKKENTINIFIACVAPQIK